MGAKPRTIKGKSTNDYENVFTLRNRPYGNNTISIENLDPDSTGYELYYRIAAKANRDGGITEYIAGGSGGLVPVTIAAGGVKTHFISSAWDEVVVQIKSKASGNHNYFQVDIFTSAANEE